MRLCMVIVMNELKINFTKVDCPKTGKKENFFECESCDCFRGYRREEFFTSVICEFTTEGNNGP